MEEKTTSWQLARVGLLVEMNQAEAAALAGLTDGRRDVERRDGGRREASVGTCNGSSWSTSRILARVMVL